MTRSHLIHLCAIVTLVLLSCNKEENPPPLEQDFTLIFGTHYGFCFGECVTLYKLENGLLYIDDMDRLTETLTFETDPLTLDKAEIAKPLLDLFPKELFKEKEVIGIPDAHDQGGFFIQHIQGDQIAQWNIDTIKDRLPSYLQDYITEVENVMDQLK